MMVSAAMILDDPVALPDEPARLRRGDPEALAAVIARYQHRLYRYFVRLVDDPAAAEDLFQQTWVKVIENLRQYDPRRGFEAWLFSVAHNLAIDYLRRRRPESLDESEVRLESSHPDALEQTLEWERAALLGTMLRELPAIHREVLALRFEEDLKLEEIAGVVQVPLSTVKSRLRRALDELRGKLERKFRTERRA